MSDEYMPCASYVVTMRLLGKDAVKDTFAEHHACKGCGAPAGYRCRGEGDFRLICREIKPEERVAVIHGLQQAEWQRTHPDEAELRRRLGIGFNCAL